MKWFKHDSNASMDAKLRKLRLRYGMEGYGVYWYCLELIAGTVEKHNLTFELEHDSEIISADTGLHVDRINEMMSFMVNSGLFETTDSGVIKCIKMATRTDEYTQKLIKTQETVPILSRQTPDSVGIKSELIEENKIEKKNNRSRFAPPSFSEVSEYVTKMEYKYVDPESFHCFYESKGWMIGKSKMKSWQKAVQGWNSRNKGNGEYLKKTSKDNIFAI